ncbi:hypothetical protein GCM10022226_53590 [Sphaerisporangium flaviroseum]|uniref:Transposase DDE domain-containing protein n=1 Tax=Sphaerisporangium flaviroseum TaxID=509199 RepID=A0ABP7IT62_9ACTN
MERCFGKLKQWRAIATRFDKIASRYLAGTTIGCLMRAGAFPDPVGCRISTSFRIYQATPDGRTPASRTSRQATSTCRGSKETSKPAGMPFMVPTRRKPTRF